MRLGLGDTNILLVGCGKMGGAMLAGWAGRDDHPARIMIVEPGSGASSTIADRDFIQFVSSATEIPADFKTTVMVLAVKPQQMDTVLPGLRQHAEAGALCVSIAAGKTIGYFQNALGPSAKIVRTMPNTPAAVGRGITVLTAGRGVETADRDLAEALLSAVGETAWVEDETLLDAVTALSGGGPAYVFLLIETLAKAGEAAGLPADLAMRLARTTVCGAGELAHRSSETAETLRQNVTSPGGTTKAALDVLMADGGLQTLMTRAIAAATHRSRELAG